MNLHHEFGVSAVPPGSTASPVLDWPSKPMHWHLLAASAHASVVADLEMETGWSEAMGRADGGEPRWTADVAIAWLRWEVLAATMRALPCPSRG